MNSPQTTQEWILSLLYPNLPIGVAFSFVSNYAIFYFLFKSEAGRKAFGNRRHGKHVPTASQILEEMKHAIVPECILSVIFALILGSKNASPIHHLLKIEWSLSMAAIPRIAVECFAIFWAYEIYYYFLHRVLHHPRVFPYAHRRHHLSTEPTPQTGTSVDLLEAISFYSFYVVLLFCPVHILSLGIVGLNIKFASLTQHMGHEIFPRWIRRSNIFKYANSTYYHHLHHSDAFNRNYGFQTSFLDRLFGTVNSRYLRYEKEN